MTSRVAQAPIAVGVDVSKDELVVAELFDDGCFARRRVSNTMDAAEAFVDELAGRGFDGRIVVESTGHHQWPLVLAAADAGLDVRLINPLQAAARRQGRVRKTKNDRIDAEVLAEMAWTERALPAPFERSRATIALRQQLQLTGQIERSIQQLQATLAAQREAAGRAGVTPPATLDELEASVARLKAQRRALQRESDALARQVADRQIATAVARLPGITADCARMLAAMLDPAASRDGWVAYVGLDVSVVQSGRFEGRGRLTKRGMPYLRKRVYQSAWGAVMHYPAAKRYYDALRQRGRQHKEALVIIARKLLRAAHALARDPAQSVDMERLFALPA